ncbi:MAG: hypothetical protein SGILL_002969 [Bacillariaceae sp.]
MLAEMKQSYQEDNNVVGDEEERPSSQQQQQATESNVDWILDGHAEWHKQYQKTAALLEELYPRQQQEFDDTALLLQLGSPLGKQEYQFATFPPEADVEGDMATPSSAQTTPSTTSLPTNHPEFKQFWKQAVTAPTPCATFDQGSTESGMDNENTNNNNNDNDDDPNFPDNVMDPIDKFLLEKMAAKALGREMNMQSAFEVEADSAENNNSDDDSDFGDFQQAAAGAAVAVAATDMEEDTTASNDGGDNAAADDAAVMDQAANPQDDDGHNDHDGDAAHNNEILQQAANANAVDTATINAVETTVPAPKEVDENGVAATNSSDGGGDVSAVPLQQEEQDRSSVAENDATPVEDDQDNDDSKPSAIPARSNSTGSSSVNNSAHNGGDSVSSNSAIETMPNESPPPKQYSDERYQATCSSSSTLLPVEPPTPVTRNYYSSPSPMKAVGDDDDDDDSVASSAPSPRRRKFQFERRSGGNDGTENDDDDEESASREESILWTAQQQEDEDHSIPKEVKLVTTTNRRSNDVLAPTHATPAKDSIRIPQTVRVSSTAASPYMFPTPSSLSSPSFYFGRNASNGLPAATSLFPQYLMESGENDEPSISSSLASPEVKFLRRHRHRHNRIDSAGALSYENNYNRSTHPDGNDNDDDDEDADFDEEESVSLSSLGTMPENYLKHPDLDYTMQELNKLEWDWLPFWKMDRLLDENDEDTGEIVCDTSKIPLLQEQITQRLSKLDVFYRKVEMKVFRKIQPHSEELDFANQSMLDSQKNLNLAQMYLSKTQDAIQWAKYGTKSPTTEVTAGLGVYGAMQLLDSWDKLASQQEMSSVLESVSAIFDLEVHILERINTFDTYQHHSLTECQAIIDLVNDLKEQSNGPITSRIECLDDVRKRAERQLISTTLVARLHELLEEMVALWCTESNDSTSLEDDLKAYERLMHAFQLVFNESHIVQDGTKDPRAFSSSICTTIHTALLLEAQKAFGRALLSPSNDAAEDDEEENTYATELDALRYQERFLDAARVPVWTHNAVTIRFDFSMKDRNYHPLPHVFHKLCWLLSNTLLGMKRIIEWHDEKLSEHKESDKSLVFLIRQELPKRRAPLWNACIQSLEGCVEEYLKFVGHKKLFTWDGDSCDDSSWLEDLEGLQESITLAKQFLWLHSFFLQDVPVEVVTDGDSLRDKLDSCCKRHVRTFHVSTMNSLGGMLYREDWQLQPMSMSTSDGGTKDVSKHIIQEISLQLSRNNTGNVDVKPYSDMNGFLKKEGGFQLVNGDNSTNPFDTDSDRQKHLARESRTTILSDLNLDFSNEHTSLIADTLTEYLGDSTDESQAAAPRAMTKSILYGIIPWCARVFVLIQKLPSVSTQAMLVLSNVFDLYATTAFRLAAGSARSERMLLGLDTCKQFRKNANIESLIGSRFASQSFGGFGRSSQPSTSRHANDEQQQIPNSIEAEMACFVVEETKDDKLSLLSDLILNGQRSLQGIAKLDLVNSWIVDPALEKDTDEEEFALQSARVLEQRAAVAFNIVCLAATLHLSATCLESVDNPFLEYRDKFVQCMPAFLKLSNRMITMRAICGKSIVAEIVSLENVWAEKSKLHEQPNDYVENLCDYCFLLWENIQSLKNRLPNGILELLRDDITSAGLMTLIEGFSRIPHCSTEGRALMSMDVAAYRSLCKQMKDNTKASPPMRLQSYRSVAYVDLYIKMFYFPHEEAVTWIQENYEKYHYPHMLALVLSTAPNAVEAKTSIQLLNGLYGRKNGASGGRLVRL